MADFQGVLVSSWAFLFPVRFHAAPGFSLIVAFMFTSGISHEWNRHHQAVWLVRGFAGFCGAIWGVVLRR